MGKPSYPLQHKTASLLQREIADYLVQTQAMMITVRHVDLTKDFRSAQVWYSAEIELLNLAEDEQKKRLEVIAKRLDACRFKLRRHLAQKVNLRSTPEIFFHYDEAGLASDRLYSQLSQIE